MGSIKRIPEFGLGGFLAGAAKFAGKLNPFVALGSGIFNIGKGIFQGIKQNKQQKLAVQEADALALEQRNEGINTMQTAGNMGAGNAFMPTFPVGGMAGDNLIKIQKNETVQEPDGSVIQANVGTHAANQDVAVNVEDGSQVYTDDFGPVKGGPSFAKIHADLTRRINKIEQA